MTWVAKGAARKGEMWARGQLGCAHGAGQAESAGPEMLACLLGKVPRPPISWRCARCAAGTRGGSAPHAVGKLVPRAAADGRPRAGGCTRRVAAASKARRPGAASSLAPRACIGIASQPARTRMHSASVL